MFKPNIYNKLQLLIREVILSTVFVPSIFTKDFSARCSLFRRTNGRRTLKISPQAYIHAMIFYYYLLYLLSIVTLPNANNLLFEKSLTCGKEDVEYIWLLLSRRWEEASKFGDIFIHNRRRVQFLLFKCHEAEMCNLLHRTVG